MQESTVSYEIRPEISSGNLSFFSACKHLSAWDERVETSAQVVTCFLQQGDRILILQRGKKDAQYQLWGIPGGKLNDSENAIEGLCREIYEETGAVLFPSDFTYIGSANSKTSTDGKYGLHLYHAKFPQHLGRPVINPTEHLSYKWVSLTEFMKMNLLHAQKEAFLFAKDTLLKILNAG